MSTASIDGQRPNQVPISSSAHSERITELLERTGEGCRQSFAELYSLTARKVLVKVAVLVRDQAQAEEVTQEVFLEIWRRAHRFDRSKGSGLGWLLALARSRAIDRVRQAQAAKSHEDSFGQRNFEPDFDQVAELVLATDTARQVRSAVGMLNPLQRQVVTHTFLTGHTYLEASRALDVPLSTLKSRMREALRALRTSAPLL